MPNLDWTARPRRMFYVRRRVLNGGIYLVHLAKIYRLNRDNDRVWWMCDGEHAIDDIVTEIRKTVTHGDLETLVEWVCGTLLFFQNNSLIGPLYAESYSDLPLERYDWRVSPELVALVLSRRPQVRGDGIAVRDETLRPFVDRVFRLCYESYFAAHGQWSALQEHAFRNYWEESAVIDLEKAADEWADVHQVKSLFFEIDRGFCRMEYAGTVYEGFVGHRR